MPAVLIGVAINSCCNLELITTSGLLLLILRGWRKKWAAIIATASGNDEFLPEKETRVDFKWAHPSTCTDTDEKKYVCAPGEVLLFRKVQRCWDCQCLQCKRSWIPKWKTQVSSSIVVAAVGYHTFQPGYAPSPAVFLAGFFFYSLTLKGLSTAKWPP